MLKELIENNMILVLPNNIKENVIKEVSSLDKIYNIKFMSLKELIDSLTFNYDERSIYYLIKKYDMNYDVANIYLNNLKYTVNNVSDKTNKLTKIKNELIENNLLIYDKNIDKLIDNKKIKIYGYDYISKFDLDILKGKGIKAQIINKNVLDFNHDVYEFEDIKDEIYFILSKIIDLLNNGVDINNIKLCNVTSEYENDIKRMFKMFNISLNIKDNKSIKSSLIAKDFIDILENNNIDETLDFITNKYDMTILSNKYIVDELIKILNKYTFVKEKDILIYILKNELSKKHLKEIKKKNAVNIIDLKDSIISENDYVFLIGFNMGNIPRIYKDEDYLSDIEKEKLNIEKSYEKNSLEKNAIINSIKSVKNLFITYKLKTNFDSYMPSLLISDMNLNVIKDIEKKYNYSKKYNELLLSEKLDNLIKFGENDKDLGILHANRLNDNYLKYDNKFKGINKEKFNDRLNGKLLLSYSSIDNYNRCAFRYYLNNILKITEFEETFAQSIGTIFHDVLSKAFKENFDFDLEFENVIKEYDFSNKEEFFMKKLKEELRFIIDTINKQNSFNSLDKSLYENKVYINKEGNIKLTFMGIIDKLLYKEENNKTYLVIIDYKTGFPHTNLNNTIYGIDMQLPVYLYLAKEGLFKNAEVIGFYLQKILNNEIVRDQKKTYEQQKEDNLKLLGYTIDEPELASKFDFSYTDSEVVKSLKFGQNGFYAYSKVLSEEKINKLIGIVKDNIDNAFDNILDAKFDINPKRVGKDNIGCSFCKYSDICFMKEEDVVLLDEHNNLDFL